MSDSIDAAAIRRWHGQQIRGHRSNGKTLLLYRQDEAGQLVQIEDDDRRSAVIAAVPTLAAWWCACGEPLHGGYGPQPPQAEVAAAFRAQLGAR